MTRKLLNARGLSVSGLLVCLGCLFWFVSILSVVKNFWAVSNDFGTAYGFVTDSFIHTSLIVQAVSLGIIAVGLYFIFDLYKTYLYGR